MKEEKFKVIDYIRKLIIKIDTELVNFPKKEIEIKNRIRTNTFDILEFAYEANEMQSIEEKNRLLSLIIAKIKVIDFLINLSYDKQLINNKKYIKLAEKMDDIIKYTVGWRKSINEIRA